MWENISNMTCEEFWEKYPDGKERYFVSNLGRVYDNKNKKILNQHTNKITGYVTVHLGGKNEYVHRAVALTFIKNENNKPQVNHIDGNKTNNNVTNLEWVTASENVIHAAETGLRNDSTPLQQAARRKTGKVTGKKLSSIMTERTKQKVEITETLTGITKVFDSGADASRYYGHTISWARGIINNPTREFSGRYLELKPWNIENVPGNSKSFSIYDKTKNRHYIFSHAEHADKYFGKSRGYFSEIIRDGGENSYWKAEYVL